MKEWIDGRTVDGSAARAPASQAARLVPDILVLIIVLHPGTPRGPAPGAGSPEKKREALVATQAVLSARSRSARRYQLGAIG